MKGFYRGMWRGRSEYIEGKFLIQMTISLGFGVVFTTALTLLFVPTLYRIMEDVMDHFRREEPAPVEAGTAAKGNWQTVGSGQQAS